MLATDEGELPLFGCESCSAFFNHQDLNEHAKTHQEIAIGNRLSTGIVNFHCDGGTEKNSVEVEKKILEIVLETTPMNNDGSYSQATVLDLNLPSNKTKDDPQARKSRTNRGPDYKDEDDGGQTYSCDHCLRSFRRKSNLKRHMVKLHQNNDQPEESLSNWFTGYCCDVCGEGLQLKATMMAHRDVFHPYHPEMDWHKFQTSLARVKYCYSCKRYFRVGPKFDEHACDDGRVNSKKGWLVKEAEDKEPTYFCDVCNICFKWKWDLRLHRENDHNNTANIDWSTLLPQKLQFVCEKCFKGYSNEANLRSHDCSGVSTKRKNSSLVKPFICRVCGNDYYWKSDFRRHVRLKHPKENNYEPTEHDTKIYLCPYCDEKFTTKKRVLQHIRKVHYIDIDSPFVCVKCNKVFRRGDNLERHNNSYHPKVQDSEAEKILKDMEIRINGDILYRCSQCNRNFSNPNLFVSHYKGHHEEFRFTCDRCGKLVKTQNQLNTHIKNIHLNIRNYKCSFCDKSFYLKLAREEHQRIHTGERPFSCEICGKTFVAGNALISHKRFHNDFYPHSCHMCPKKFKIRRSLINHIRTHTGERPFTCDLCAESFKSSSQYLYHKKITHSDAKPFCCPVCNNSFKTNRYLARHMELHSAKHQVQTHEQNNAPKNGKSKEELNYTNEEPHVDDVIADIEKTVEQTTSMTMITVDTDGIQYNEVSGILSLSNVSKCDDTRGFDKLDCELQAMERPLTAAEAYVAATSCALAPTEQ